jgi:hypothetical protein
LPKFWTVFLGDFRDEVWRLQGEEQAGREFIIQIQQDQLKENGAKNKENIGESGVHFNCICDRCSWMKIVYLVN